LPAEDAIFTTYCFIKSSKVYYIPDIVYAYRQREAGTSISTNCTIKYFNGISEAYKIIYEHFKDQFAFEAPNHELYVTSRDSLACAINNAAIDLGFKVPDDLETIGVVGTKQASMSRPTISTIDVDLFEVGSISMRMLTKLIKDNLDKKSFIFKTHYKKRNSTKM
jgi:DNA-binding LacI/PurR family transcriptional regulator